MNGLYLGALLFSIAGMTVLDARFRLFLFAEPKKAFPLLAAAVVGFLLWDNWGVGLGIFFEGDRDLLVGVDIAREVPLEEVFFLVLLCLSAMHAFVLAERALARRARPRGRTGSTADGGAGRMHGGGR